MTVETLATSLRTDSVTLVDLAASPDYRRGHIPGAWFAIRAQLSTVARTIAGSGPIVLTSSDGANAHFAAPELVAATGRRVMVLQGGTAAWTASGRRLAAGEERMASPPLDVYRRPYEGTEAGASAMQAYLDWEHGLVAQLERDGSHGFFVI